MDFKLVECDVGAKPDPGSLSELAVLGVSCACLFKSGIREMPIVVRVWDELGKA